MLYVLYGNDRVHGLKYFQTLRSKLSNGEVLVEVVPEENISSGWFDEALVSKGLFGGNALFVLSGVLEKKENQELLVVKKEGLARSENIFLIFEPTLAKKVAEDLAPHVEEIREFALSKNESRPEFSIFSLGDALGERNKKDLWVLYQKAVASGLSDEEISGTLFWSVKNIALMKNNDGKSDAGLNPYVAKKVRMYAKNYTHEEIKNISQALTSLYHEAHRGGEPMNIALERFILGL
ncbi:MAG: hypothetical protein AAB628_03020 [Patescibacteria group bacterium]